MLGALAIGLQLAAAAHSLVHVDLSQPTGALVEPQCSVCAAGAAVALGTLTPSAFTPATPDAPITSLAYDADLTAQVHGVPSPRAPPFFA